MLHHIFNDKIKGLETNSEPWPGVIAPMSLLHKHAAVPVLLCAWQTAAVILEPQVVFTVPCHYLTLLFHSS